MFKMVCLNDSFFIGVLIILLLGLVICSIYLTCIIMRHWKRRDTYLEADIDNEIYKLLVIRNFEYVRALFFFQTIGKYFEIMAVTLSLCSFAYANYEESSNMVANVLSIMSIVFVVISIYLNPSRRSREYIIAWRKSDRIVNEILEKTNRIKRRCSDADDAEKELNELFRNIPEQIFLIENDIKSDEE